MVTFSGYLEDVTETWAEKGVVTWRVAIRVRRVAHKCAVAMATSWSNKHCLLHTFFLPTGQRAMTHSGLRTHTVKRKKLTHAAMKHCGRTPVSKAFVFLFKPAGPNDKNCYFELLHHECKYSAFAIRNRPSKASDLLLLSCIRACGSDCKSHLHPISSSLISNINHMSRALAFCTSSCFFHAHTNIKPPPGFKAGGRGNNGVGVGG